jgi:peptide chain release factor 2
MTHEDLKIILDKIKELIDSIDKKVKLLDLKVKLDALSKIKNAIDFWQSKDQAEVLKEYSKCFGIFNDYSNVKSKYSDIIELLDGFAEEIDLNEIAVDIYSLKKQAEILRITLLMDREDDNKNCFFDINSGAGGTEAQDWADMIFRMYMRFFEKNGFKYDLVDYQSGEAAGIKAATLFVKGKYACGILSCEAGIHRLVRISPFDSNKRRHTSFCAVLVAPEAPDIVINIDPKDLRIDTYRAGGAGGQHVNKTDSAVRITHIPTGVVAQCQNERSQLKNKDIAMKVLKSRLYKKEQDEADTKRYGKSKMKIEWGSQIRSYVLHPYKMVKDHRTEHESPQPEKVLDGDLLEFIEQCLIVR